MVICQLETDNPDIPVGTNSPSPAGRVLAPSVARGLGVRGCIGSHLKLTCYWLVPIATDWH